MSRGNKRFREDEDDSGDARSTRVTVSAADVHARLNSSLSAPRTVGRGPGLSVGRAAKAAKHSHSQPQSQPQSQGKLSSRMRMHPNRLPIYKPVFAVDTSANEFGRSVSINAPQLAVGTLTLYAKNFVPSVDSNPHVEQMRGQRLTIRKEKDLQRTLSPDAQRMPYRRRRGEVKSVIHWSSRKLLLSLIEFLTQFAEDEMTVVVAGCSPGTTVPFLSRLFPMIHFVLIDPSPFEISATDRILIRNEEMTTELAKEFADKRTLLVSNIRSADFKLQSGETVEAAVERDMENQRLWHEAQRPVAGMYRFRLPWREGSTSYLDGEISLPVWGAPTSTESRLIVKTLPAANDETNPEQPATPLREWDNKTYEEQMFYFNNVTRCCLYHHDIAASGLDHCFDCSSEVHILKAYLQKFFPLQFSKEQLKDLSDIDVRRKISSMVDQVTVACGGDPQGRNLLNMMPYQHKKRPLEEVTVDKGTQGDMEVTEKDPNSPAIESANGDADEPVRDEDVDMSDDSAAVPTAQDEANPCDVQEEQPETSDAIVDESEAVVENEFANGDAVPESNIPETIVESVDDADL